MTKRFVIAWVVLFVVWMGTDALIHTVLLNADYRALAQLYRSPADAQGQFGWMLLAHVLLAGAFVWIYQRGISHERPWLGQGLRFGLAMALLTVVPTDLIYYAVQPLPGAMVLKQIVFSSIAMLVLGVVVAWLHRPRA